MRLLLASLILAAAPMAFAQTQPAPTPPSPAAQAPAAPPAAQAPAPATQAPAAPPAAQAPAPATQAPATPPATQAPATPPAAQAPMSAPAQTPAPAEAAPATPAPPAPPPAPTDPAAMDLIDTLQNVCVPAVEGVSLDRLAKAHGYRKSGDNYVLKGRGFQFTLYAPGSNPGQCRLDLIHPVYPEAPAAPLVVALHNWAAVSRDWSLYRNDKSIQGDQQLTTRSWEHDDPGKHEAMFITTYRHADGSPMKGGADTSTMVYSETKT